MLPTKSILACACLLQLAAVGPSSGKYLSSYGNGERLQPIASASASRRICVALCMSGLGGRPCGDGCLDITPNGFPAQSDANWTKDDGGGQRGQRHQHHDHGSSWSSSSSSEEEDKETPTGSQEQSQARKDVCPVLCTNGLGYPLCNCAGTEVVNDEVDFVQICGNLCVNFDYRLYGCQTCDVYKRAKLFDGDNFSATATATERKQEIDWDEWCRQMCIAGDGGIACNCDILPMSITV